MARNISKFATVNCDYEYV